ncbi:MAG: choice-of-anchor Q domain-containing protein, partial [Chitinophagales bacterium]
MKKLLMFYCCLSIGLSTLNATTIYVDKDATAGANNGGSWTNAYTDLQTAINSAAASDQIWVADGIYLPTVEFDADGVGGSNVRERTFYISTDGIEIYGGFNGTETNLTDRDVAANPTILSGDFNNDDATTGTPGTSTFAMTNNTENAYHVVFIDGNTAAGNISTATTIDGFQITGGHADGTLPNNTGAGICNRAANPSRECSPTIKNCNFSRHVAQFGSSIYNDGYHSTSNPVISNCNFSQNIAQNEGAGLFNNGDGGESNVIVINCNFSENIAPYGAAILNHGPVSGESNVTVINTTFLKNFATNEGGAIYNNGNTNGESSATLTNCSFFQNDAVNLGKTIYNRAAGGSTSNSSIKNCIFWGATSGGDAIYNDNATATLSYSIYDDGTTDGTITLPTGMANGGNNLEVDPLFTDAANGDLTLLVGSPAIDAGDNAANATPTDLAGNTRTQGCTIDRGAYETMSTLTLSRLYVDIDATAGANDGTTWADAFTDLQNAIDAASFCGVNEIWVADGTYHPTTEFDADGTGGSDVRERTFYINKDGIEIYGGFNGTEANLADRDVTANPTILSGDFNNNDATTGTPGTSSFAMTNNTENAYHVVFIDGTTASGNITTATTLDGFQITGGHAYSFGGNNFNLRGGGVFNHGSGTGKSCSPTIQNCSFSQNTAARGGGISNEGYTGESNPTITNCSFSQNTANDGGGIYNRGDSGQSNPSLTNCSFSQNTATYGGGIYNYGNSGISNPTITNCSFSQNTASSFGGGIYNYGNSGISNPTIIGCSFSQNTASYQGGGIYNNGSSGQSNPTITNCSFSQNTASSGGGIFNDGYNSGES